MARRNDPIAFELFKNAIFAIADEMALTVLRTTYSGVLKDNMDYSTGFADADGRLVAQGLTLPGHLGSVPTAMAAIMRHYADDMADGDVFIMNDPFDGGMHLPARCVTTPMSAVASQARMPPTPPRSMLRACASRRSNSMQRASAMKRWWHSSRRMCGCRSKCSAICARSSLLATSQRLSF